MPLPLVPVIVAGIAGAGSYLLLGLFGKSDEEPASPSPVPVPSGGGGLSSPVRSQVQAPQAPAVQPLDTDGFPQDANDQVFEDQQRIFEAIQESSPQDTIRNPQGFEETEEGGSDEGGETIDMQGFDSEEPEEEGFFDSLDVF